ERGPNWLRVCESSRCTHDIYSRPIHMKDVDDKYKLVTDVVKVSKVDGDTFRVHWFDNEVNITLEGAQLLQTEVKTKGHGYEWIHHYNYTSPLDVPLIKVKANKEITEDGAGIIVDGVRIGFDDAEEQDFDVTPISIDTSTEAFLLQPETNKSIGETIEIDPTISLTTIAEDITTRNITNITSGTSTYDKTFGGTATFGIGIDGCTPDRFRRNRAYVDFDVSSLADNVIIEETNYSFGVRGLEDDNTAINITEMDGWGSNTGAEAAWTDAGGPIYVSMNLTPNTFYTFTLGASANARLQANLSSDQFTVGLRTGEVGSVTTCPTTETDRMAINASESTPSFITATYSLSPPEVTLNAPANNSAFTSVGAIVLNATIADRNDATIKEVVFYGTNGTAPSLTDILSINLGVTNGTQLTYNWTAPVIKNQTDTLLLFHFDNRSLFGENTTLVNDYSSNNYDGIAMGSRF
ncbi:MAG: Ig-like domain-containing protein, partial [Nanoarchaeota archaeon]